MKSGVGRSGRAGAATRTRVAVRALALATALLAIPSPGPDLRAQALPEGAVEVPLQEHGGQLFVPVEAPDGTELDFILTTANAVTILSESTAERFGADAALTVGGKPLAMENAAVIPDDRLVNEDRPFAGMLSPNTLNAFNILVDLPNGRLLLAPTGRGVDWGDVPLSEPMRLRVFHGKTVFGESNSLAISTVVEILTAHNEHLIINQHRLGMDSTIEITHFHTV